jgi:predicted RNA binding protein YcfA (HicA-like mRNA interferase family)
MPQLPVIRGREVVRAFEKHGWEIARQRGRHIIMIKAGRIVTLSSPITKKLREGHCEA